MQDTGCRRQGILVLPSHCSIRLAKLKAGDQAMSTQPQARNSLLELSGLVSSMLAGALAGMLIRIPAKGVGLIATIVVLAIIGAIIWERRHQRAANTFVACVIAIVFGWPLAVVVLDWLHRYYAAS
jgi:hypothetical protein